MDSSPPQSFIKVHANAMTETERVLDLLIHDLRTPLGVAHGYLRLVRERRLPAESDHDHALAETQRALGQIGKLCEAATAFLTAEQDEPAASVDAVLLASRVMDRLRDGGLRVGEATVAPGTMVRVGSSVDRMVEAVAALLAAVARTAPRETITVSAEADATELRFTARAAAPASQEKPSPPFDPWRGYGLAVPLACKLIVDVGGRVWGAVGEAGTLSAAFPLETKPE